MRFILLLAFITFTCNIFAQPTQPADYGLKVFSIQDKQLGTIHLQQR